MLKFSVLIPVYNTEKYLKECIDSVLNQTFQNFEIILVDDGSQDASGKICDTYSETDIRVKTIHQQNMGPMMARITAFLEASGEYVIYMDSDDCWSNELLTNVNEAIRKYEVDAVSFGFHTMEEDGRIALNEAHVGSEEIQVYEINQLMVEFLTTENENSLWKRAVRREAVDKKELKNLEMFGKILLGEDMLQAFVMLKDCKTFVNLNKPLYYYRRCPESITHSNNSALIVDIAKARNCLTKIMTGTSFGAEKYQRMVEKSFLEHYLTDLVGICCMHGINTVKKAVGKIKRMDIYQSSCKNVSEYSMTAKRKLLFYLEQCEMWRCYWAVSKIYCLKRYIQKGD